MTRHDPAPARRSTPRPPRAARPRPPRVAGAARDRRRRARDRSPGRRTGPGSPRPSRRTWPSPPSPRTASTTPTCGTRSCSVTTTRSAAPPSTPSVSGRDPPATATPSCASEPRDFAFTRWPATGPDDRARPPCGSTRSLARRTPRWPRSPASCATSCATTSSTRRTGSTASVADDEAHRRFVALADVLPEAAGSSSPSPDEDAPDARGSCPVGHPALRDALLERLDRRLDAAATATSCPLEAPPPGGRRRPRGAPRPRLHRRRLAGDDRPVPRPPGGPLVSDLPTSRGPPRRRGRARPGAAAGDDRDARHGPRPRRRRQDGRVEVELLPTYSGCPATEMIERDVVSRRRRRPRRDRRARALPFDPPWTAERIDEEGRRRLRGFGIAPPGGPIGAAHRGPGTLPRPTDACRWRAIAPGPAGEARARPAPRTAPVPLLRIDRHRAATRRSARPRAATCAAAQLPAALRGVPRPDRPNTA
jgi:metal-sulfur cluster biosynthetic enzyme